MWKAVIRDTHPWLKFWKLPSSELFQSLSFEKTMPLSPSEFAEFEGLVLTEEAQTETRCAPYLGGATDFLLRQTPYKLITLAPENRSFFGRSDYMVVADLRSETGPIERVVEFWELKAPQSPLMEYDQGASRFRPSKELVKAESQLIHYVHDARNSGNFAQRHEVRYPSKIKAAGIIIGRDRRYMHGGTETQQADAAHSFQIRMEAIYQVCQIRILTWDRILNFLKPEDQPTSAS
ncbi:DUF4263 domain-containing protein [Mesorhizobium sp. M0134]|uniref:Shedu anti-phage system protein SduA domain-containing protein n=1 Tax=Mesorhizobium sp. M0134 TaxID=2956889 RepID=UPI00333C64AC